jgi:DNA-binding transcriptional LysR family regulator
MDFRQLRYFVAVAEELSFSRAAERLNVSQPPLSTQIKAMEHELGADLFARTKRSVKLTHAGQVLLEHARGALTQLEQAGDVTRRAGRGEAGCLLLGFTSSAPMLPLFTAMLRRFRETSPDATIDAKLMSTGQQITALAEGRLDIGIMRPTHWFKPSAELTVRRLWRDELHVFLPDDHPLLRYQDAIPVEALAEQDFISFASDIGCGLSEHLHMLCGRAGFRPKIIQEVNAATVILGLVAAGVGIAVLPECQKLGGIAGVASRRLAAPDVTSDLLLAHRSAAPSPLLHRFLAAVDDTVAV